MSFISFFSKASLILISSWLLSSCSVISGALSPSDLTQSLRAVEEHKPLREIQTAGFSYDSFYCGPAGLATLLHKKNRAINLPDMSMRLITPGKNGTFKADLTAEARKRGLIPITKTDQPRLLVEALANDEPVLTLVNLSFNWAPQWHYFAVYGYNRLTESFLVHDGKGGTTRIDSETFDRLWARADYWMLTTHEPTDIPPKWINARDWLDETLTASKTLQDVNIEAAKTGLKRWPNEAAFAFILGDIAYTKADLAAAASYFELATRIDPKLMAGFYNLAYVQFESENFSAAEQSAKAGLRLEGEKKLKANLQGLLDQIQKKSAESTLPP